MADNDILSRFAEHIATEDTNITHSDITLIIIDAMFELDSILPAGREKSLVTTKMQEVLFWAHQSISVKFEEINRNTFIEPTTII